ncbi:Arc family DNA-binding protein [Acinetobacter harbinensis]|uniref:Arc family DNA-binding protein n=1 Tax=Acinetobacter harbinensis TaxID=1353941 RepID=UPI001C4F07B5|nr:Arc family DNA-binding protein [Acinetobacter harbinensis]
MARNDPQMNLRVPMELKENIEKAALDNGRTITAEAVYRLEQSFSSKSSSTDYSEIDKKINHLQELIEIMLKKQEGK